MFHDSIKLLLKISDDQADAQRLQDITLSLMLDLRDFDVVVTQASPLEMSEHGTKGDPFAWGALILVSMPALMPQIMVFLQNWLIERRKIVIEAPNGAKIEFTPDKKYSESEIISLVDKLNQLSKP